MPIKLYEAQNYEDMFAFMRPVLHSTDQTEVANAIKWAKATLLRKDRITWYLRVYRVALIGGLLSDWGNTLRNVDTRGMTADQFEELKTGPLPARLRKIYMDGMNAIGKLNMIQLRQKLAHYMGVAQSCDTIRDFTFGRQSVDVMLSQLADLEATWQAEVDQEVAPQPGDEILIQFPDGFAWVNTNRSSCSAEGRAMGHCGNGAEGVDGDRLLSLRKKLKNGNYRPSLTFILDKNGLLGETKGRENFKPKPKYHPYILSLLMNPIVKGIKGGGYEPEHNFEIKDLNEAQRAQLFAAKPIFMSCSAYLEAKGLDQDLMGKIIGIIDGMDDAPRFSGFQDIEGQTFVVSKDIWEFVSELCSRNSERALSHYIDGEFLGERFREDDWLTDSRMVSDFPTTVQDKIVEYCEVHDGAEVRSYLDLDEDESFDIDDALAYIQEHNSPSEIYDALQYAMDEGYAAGSQKAADSSIRSQINSSLDNCVVMWDKGIVYIPTKDLCALVDNGPINDRWNEEPISIDMDNDYSDWSQEAALEQYLASCPDEATPAPVVPIDLKSMSREEMIALYSQITNQTPQDGAIRFDRYDDAYVRSLIARKVKSHYGAAALQESARRIVRMLSESTNAAKLSDVASLRVGNPDADFWIERRGTPDTVGRVSKEYNPQSIGVTVTRTDILNPQYIYYALMHIHSQGKWKQEATGSIRLVGITTKQVGDVRLG